MHCFNLEFVIHIIFLSKVSISDNCMVPVCCNDLSFVLVAVFWDNNDYHAHCDKESQFQDSNKFIFQGKVATYYVQQVWCKTFRYLS